MSENCTQFVISMNEYSFLIIHMTPSPCPSPIPPLNQHQERPLGVGIYYPRNLGFQLTDL